MNEWIGGMAHDPPAACGLGEWDKPGGPAGKHYPSKYTYPSPYKCQSHHHSNTATDLLTFIFVSL